MVTRKKAGKKKVISKRSSSRKSNLEKNSPVRMSKADDLLIQNFVGLQKVIVELSIKLNDLSSNMARLLNLFEVSAETLVKKEFHVGEETNKEILNKLNFLTEQNKLVARGLVLMGDRNPSATNDFALNEIPSSIPSQLNMAPMPFQRTSENLNSFNSSPSFSSPQNSSPRVPSPQVIRKQEIPMEVPGSEEEETE